eukprot:6179046-Pleurochrysis_carterae.AAC.2
MEHEHIVPIDDEAAEKVGLLAAPLHHHNERRIVWPLRAQLANHRVEARARGVGAVGQHGRAVGRRRAAKDGHKEGGRRLLANPQDELLRAVGGPRAGFVRYISGAKREFVSVEREVSSAVKGRLLQR